MNEIVKNVGSFLTKNRRIIVTGGTIISFGVTMVSAVVDSRKADLTIAKLKENGKEPDKKELAKVYAKSYWKTAVLFSFTVAMVACNSYFDAKEITGLASAYALTEKKLVDFKEATTAIVGEKKTDEIEKEVTKKNLSKAVASNNAIINTGNGTTLFFDDWSGRLFYSDIEKVRRAVNDLNQDMFDDGYVSADDLYWRLGLPQSGMGTHMGWCMDASKKFNVSFGSMLTENDEPCVTIHFSEPPYYNFDS